MKCNSLNLQNYKVPCGLYNYLNFRIRGIDSQETRVRIGISLAPEKHTS